MAVPREVFEREAYQRAFDVSQQVLQQEVLDAAERAQNWLLAQQAEEGYWVGELEGDSILESEYILLLVFLGYKKHLKKIKALARYVLEKQEPHGGWSIYPGGPPDLSASVKAYFALKLAGYDPSLPFMEKARNLILSLGGVDKANSFTKIYLAVLGQYPWEKCPAIWPEIILFPKWFYFNIYAMSSWSRTIVVPLSIIYAFKPVVNPPVNIKELFVSGMKRHGEKWNRNPFTWRNSFLAVDKVLKLLERFPWNPLRQLALKKAEEWMFDHFRKSDGLGAIFPPMVNAVMALKVLGYPESHPAFKEAMRQLQGLEIMENGVLRMQPCVSPVWDTALSITALHESGVPSDDPAIINAAKWLLSKEVTEEGDWKVYNPKLPVGGWAFEFNNEFYPDVDDSSMVLIALSRVHLPEKKGAVSRAIKWILGMQGKDGGWAAFDRDNNHQILTHVPFADHNAMLDPSCPDITGRTLEALAAYGYTMVSPCVKRAIQYLKRVQEPEGCWYGRWGVNYIYGTWQVLKGLSCIGEDMKAPYVQKAVQWLYSVQNPDGGWGESCHSYDDPNAKAKGTSTASQTAWALMGLMAAGDYESPAFLRGLRWLLSRQNEQGTWEEAQFTGTGFPKVFYLRYHLYRHYFPLFAFGIFLNRLRKNSIEGMSEGSFEFLEEESYSLFNNLMASVSNVVRKYTPFAMKEV
jgi:squalene-hopene/tetraprenyl-beta-curcumene cyclase